MLRALPARYLVNICLLISDVFLTVIAHLLVCQIRGHLIRLDSICLHILVKKQTA